MRQQERILREMRHVLESEHSRACDGQRLSDLTLRLQSLADKPDGLTDLIWTSLQIRHALAVTDPSDTWRECLSWIGSPPTPARTLDYEYMRSEQRLGPQARWRTYYPWLTERPVATLPILHNSAMASIASLFLALKAVREGQATVIVASRLYYETRQLLQRMLAGSSITLVECDTDERFLDELARRRPEPVIAWLDSAETADTPALFDAITEPGFSSRLLAVAWDNTLVPYWQNPLRQERSITIPLFLVRSLHKLDQLGLELASVGMLTLVAPRRTSSQSAVLLRGLLDDLMISTKVLGATASPTSVRLLDALRLPDQVLVEASNRAARHATARLAAQLREALPPPFGVVEFPHACFANVRCQGRTEADVHAIMADVVSQAEIERLPIERAASVGFSFTGMSVFTAHDPHTGGQETFLRVAVGGHDDDVIDRVTACFVTGLRARQRH
ncbi:hypothetical protein Nm8I071_55300 [Nonomuraea sp. TT08I-71]|nr:hypothetical protein Nm8I071_55300 [Nonomuraea sp. TT08I-71]